MKDRRRNPGRRKSDKYKPLLTQAVIFLLAMYVSLTGTLLMNRYIG